MILKVSNAYARNNDSDLIEFSRNSIEKMTNNPSFKTPMVDLAQMTTATDALDNAVIAAYTNDRLKIAEKNSKREALITLLAQQAAYVQSIAAGDLNVLLSSGFQPVSTNRSQVELSAPVIENVENSASGQLSLRLSPVKTAKSYEVRMAYGAVGWHTVGVFTQSRNIVLDNLTPGTLYQIQVRAIGGSTGASTWSDPTSRMSS